MMGSILIKDVDKELYARFKAEAALKGIKVGEALQLAMEKWLMDDQALTDRELERIKNNALFRQLLPDLIEEHRDKWILISGGSMIGLYSSKSEVFEVIKDQQLTGRHNLIAPLTDKTRRVRLGFGRVRQ